MEKGQGIHAQQTFTAAMQTLLPMMALSLFFGFLLISFISFISGHISGGHVTVTVADWRLYYNYEHVITQHLYISYGKSDMPVAYLHKLLNVLFVST